jgi:hypothetical protein
MYGREAHTGVWWGNLKEGKYLEHADVRWEDNIKIDLQEVGRGKGLDRSGLG